MNTKKYDNFVYDLYENTGINVLCLYDRRKSSWLVFEHDAKQTALMICEHFERNSEIYSISAKFLHDLHELKKENGNDFKVYDRNRLKEKFEDSLSNVIYNIGICYPKYHNSRMPGIIEHCMKNNINL